MPWIKQEDEPDLRQLIAKLVERIERLEWRVLLLEGDAKKRQEDEYLIRTEDIPF